MSGDNDDKRTDAPAAPAREDAPADVANEDLAGQRPEGIDLELGPKEALAANPPADAPAPAPASHEAATARVATGADHPAPRASFWPAVAGGLLGGAAAAAALWLVIDQQGQDPAIAGVRRDLTSVQEQVGGLGTQAADLERLRDQVAALEAMPAEGEGAMEEVAALDQRVGALEGGLESMRTQASDISNALANAQSAAASGREEALRAVQQAGEIQANLDQMRSGLAEMTDQLAALTQRVDQVQGRVDFIGGNFQRAAGMVVAIGDIDRAVVSAEPFASSLETLKQLGQDDQVVSATIDRLQPVAANGVISMKSLREGYGAMAEQVIGTRSEGEGTVLDQATSNLLSLVKVRPVGEDVEGEDEEAITARAEAKLESGDLAGSVSELEQLEGEAAAAAADWLAGAKARLEAEAAVSDLRRRAQELLATEAG